MQSFQGGRQIASGLTPRKRTVENVVGTPVDVIDWDEAVEQIIGWSRARESKIVCICAVHSIVTALQDEAHASCLRNADMVTPDGAPVAWMLKTKGHPGQERICGPDLMMMCCRRAADEGEKIFLYGGTPQTLSQLERVLRARYPKIEIVGAFSPPFRPLTDEEDAAVVDMINRSGAGIVWIGLGCPKQEAWMSAHRGRVNAVMIGVGAAFDFNAGAVKRAPAWMQRSGLEWLYRMAQDPQRLAKRYLVTNTIFVLAATKDLVLSRWAGRVTNGSESRQPVPLQKRRGE